MADCDRPRAPPADAALAFPLAAFELLTAALDLALPDALPDALPADLPVVLPDDLARFESES